MPDEAITRLREGAVDKSIETIRSRIDAFGVAEPDIRKGQEGTEIIVQLPGLSERDFGRAKELIGKTAQLEFRMCDDEGNNDWVTKHQTAIPQGVQGSAAIEVENAGGGLMAFKSKSKAALEEFLKDKVDLDHYVGFENIQTKQQVGSVQLAEGYWRTVYLHHAAPLTGEFISDARVAVDQRDQKPFVSLTFDSTLPEDSEGSLGCGAINLEWFADSVAVGEEENVLGSQYNIVVRVGLHCAPMAHRTIGTFPDGTVRLSMGYFNTPEDVDAAVQAIRRIAA